MNIVHRQRGQSMVETVVFLPVLVVIFLGMFYLKGLINTKHRAIEAARYVTWENTWIPREGIDMDVAEDDRPNRGFKTDDQLKTELQQLGLGTFLERVQGTKQKEKIGDYFNRLQPGSATLKGGIPTVLSEVLGGSGPFSSNSDTSSFQNNPDGSPGDSQSSASGNGAGPDLDIGQGLNSLLNVFGQAAFPAFEFFGRQTKWGTEADESVITSQVVYKYAAGGTRLFVPRFVAEQSSILSHPWNIKRSTDEEEHNRLAGTGGLGECTDADDRGHIFDLWLVPSGGDLSPLRAVPKCPIVAIINVVGFLGKLNFLDNPQDPRVPNGTLKEYPEMDLPTNLGNGGTGSNGGSGLGGGNTQPPRAN